MIRGIFVRETDDLKIAQRFIAGIRRQEGPSPVGTAECFSRPYGTQSLCYRLPTDKSVSYYQMSLRDTIELLAKISNVRASNYRAERRQGELSESIQI